MVITTHIYIYIYIATQCTQVCSTKYTTDPHLHTGFLGKSDSIWGGEMCSYMYNLYKLGVVTPSQNFVCNILQLPSTRKY